MRLKINPPEAEQKSNSLRRMFLYSIILLLPSSMLAQQSDDSVLVKGYNTVSFFIGIKPASYNIPLASDIELPISNWGGGFLIGAKYNKIIIQCDIDIIRHYWEQIPDSIFRSKSVLFSRGGLSFKYYFPIKKAFQPYCLVGIDNYSLKNQFLGDTTITYGIHSTYSIGHFGLGFDFPLNKYFFIGLENTVALVNYSIQDIGSETSVGYEYLREIPLDKNIRGIYYIPSIVVTYQYDWKIQKK
ncbi:MAG: hypothetical protein PHX21_06480 [bacterium]|nr:hypothetical protein [bacterium]